MTELSRCRIAVTAGLLLVLNACERQEIRVYTAPKEMPAAPPAATAATGAPQTTAPSTADARAALPQMQWDVPAGWQSTDPGRVSTANFVLTTDQGEASINVTPLPNLAGKEDLVVNMWRQQVGLEALGATEVAKALTPVQIGDQQGQLFEITGTRDGKPNKIVTAMMHQDGVSWFFKLAGDAAMVDAQKPVFLEFLKSVRPADSSAQPTSSASNTPAPVASAAPPAKEYQWQVPKGWEQVAPGAMQVAKFKVPAQGAATAELAISVFPNDTGGTLANVNRWRAQLGLPPVDEAALAGMTTPLDPSIPNAAVVDLSNNGRQMLAAIVPRENQWWFYKLMGDAPAVSAAREAFVAFAKKQP